MVWYLGHHLNTKSKIGARYWNGRANHCLLPFKLKTSNKLTCRSPLYLCVTIFCMCVINKNSPLSNLKYTWNMRRDLLKLTISYLTFISNFIMNISAKIKMCVQQNLVNLNPKNQTLRLSFRIQIQILVKKDGTFLSRVSVTKYKYKN